jgi:hypothetical protein
MKLNNHGWGLQMMMVFVLILMICLVIVAALIDKNFKYLEDETVKSTTFDYSKLEKQVVEATQKYIDNKKIQLDNDDTYTITIKKLQNENLLDEIKDDSKKCTGYSVVENISGKLIYNAYINCGSNYKTKNYSSNFDN